MVIIRVILQSMSRTQAEMKGCKVLEFKKIGMTIIIIWVALAVKRSRFVYNVKQTEVSYVYVLQ